MGDIIDITSRIRRAAPSTAADLAALLPLPAEAPARFVPAYCDPSNEQRGVSPRGPWWSGRGPGDELAPAEAEPLECGECGGVGADRHGAPCEACDGSGIATSEAECALRAGDWL